MTFKRRRDAPESVTAQMLENYRRGGAAINVIARRHSLAMTVVDAGVVRAPGSTSPPAQDWIASGTRNFRIEPAMTAEQCTRAIKTWRRLAAEAVRSGSNALLLGGMGIDNTACAALVWPLIDATARLSGWSITRFYARLAAQQFVDLSAVAAD